MVCYLFADVPCFCYVFHEQFPKCAGVRPAADEARLVAFSRVTVARGDQFALGNVGNRFVDDDPENVDEIIVSCWNQVLLPRGQENVMRGADAKGVLGQTLHWTGKSIFLYSAKGQTRCQS